jgi:hypothetical protein
MSSIKSRYWRIFSNIGWRLEDGEVYSREQRLAAVFQPPKCQPPRSTPDTIDFGAVGGMQMSFDRILVARILFTLMTAGWALLTVVADFNKTHATKPQWTPYARFHVVWQISSYVGLGLLAFALIWWPGPLAVERLYFVAAMGAVVYAAFFAALIAMPIYGGAAYDKNGYQPFNAPIPIFAKKWDANITAFSIQLVILVAGILTVSGAIAG